MDQLWQRALKGQHTALMGLLPGEPPAGVTLHLLRISCDGPPTTLGPLLAARRKAELILDLRAPLLEQARKSLVIGLRRKLLGDPPPRLEEGALVQVWNELQKRTPHPIALLFDAVDDADKPTLDVLRRIVSRPGWLKLPLVLVYRRPAPGGPAGALLESLRTALGPEAVLEAPRPSASPVEMAAAERGDHAASNGAPRPAEAVLASLPPDVLRVLRVGAVLGSGFEAELCAALMGSSPLFVLDALQRAADAGLPLEDRGEGRIYLPAPVIQALRASTLPSLLLLLHRRVAALLIGPRAEIEISEPRAPFMGAPVPLAMDEPEIAEQYEAEEPPLAARAPAFERLSPSPSLMDEMLAARREDEPREEDAPERMSPWPYAEIFIGAKSEPPERAPFASPPRQAEVPPAVSPLAESAPPAAPRSGSARGGEPPIDAARAAQHLAAAGEIEASAEHYVAAAEQAAAMGATAQAMAHGNKALSLLVGLPNSRKRRLLRVAVLLEFGRLQWHAAGPGSAEPSPAQRGASNEELYPAWVGMDEAFTLAGALAVLERAKSELAAGDPPGLVAAASSLIASVCYDIGDLPSLERALEELSSATRLLLNGGDAVAAARLLNDQAAVYIRMGDPVRATHLLGESRKIFEERAASDPVAMIEMAETDHLFARIPLHVPARPGREGDALSMGLDHAIAAERTYKRLGDNLELARVWETMGRLELSKRRLDRAEKRLTAAAEIQTQIGDLVGLARSTAALSEVLAASGRYRDALSLLGDSVTFNVEKGSPIGLAFNRRAFDTLASVPGVSEDAGALLAEVHERLSAAESVFGRMKLPGERDVG